MKPWKYSLVGVAFDMDGLMVNTETLYSIVGQTILKRRGRTFTHELKKRMMGLPGTVAWQVMIDSESLNDSVETLDAESNEIFLGLLSTQLQPMPGLFELLDFLDSHSLPRCVATSSSRRFAEDVLMRIEAIDRIDFIVTAEDVPQGKPAPDIYLAAATGMHTTAPRTLVLEDSHHGSRAGLASGACTVAVPGEHSLDHDFTGVHYRATSLLDVNIRKLIAGDA